MDFENPQYYFNREISWMEFNFRVLEEAYDKENPLLERLKFLAITSSNLDEFFMIRVSGLKEQVNAEYIKQGIAGYTAIEQLKMIREKVLEFIELQYNCLKRSLKKKLKDEGVFFREYKELDKTQEKYIKNYFDERIYPIITPMAVDNSRPFPLLLNKSLNIVVKLYDKENQQDLYCVVQVPAILNRFVKLPSNKNYSEFILLEEIIKSNLEYFFEGYEIKAYNDFRITRNSDMNIDESEAEDLLLEIEKSLKRRKWGFPVRLEVQKNIDKSLRNFLKESLEITEEEIYEINGELDLTYFMKFSDIEGHENLKYVKRLTAASPLLYKKENYFDIIKGKDIMLHHPYQSFEHIVEFVQKASEDPDVLAIKQTLYRVSGQSPIVKALIKAAENGKQVTVLIELKARFDEERNIEWAKKLENSGCHVVYGLSGLKTHAKVILVVRKEDEGIRRYVHLGTGNYNDATAKIYTDIGLFTSREPYCMDVTNLFNILTGFSHPKDWKKISVAPFNIREKLYELIANEMKNAKEGIFARIIIKVNSVVDKEIIKKLYEAASNGVKVDMIIRGMCCLKTGIKNVSENIKVVSIIGRYLEHSRIYYFENEGNNKIFLSSADLMTRNLDRRVETLFPIEDIEIISTIKNILEVSLEDTVRTRIQTNKGVYIRTDKRGKKILDSQDYFYEKAHEELEKIKEEYEELI